MGASVLLAAVLWSGPAWAYGRIGLGVRPGTARVWVDGGPAGGVPTVIVLSAGQHLIRVSAPGCLPRVFKAHVQDGVTTRYITTLLPVPGAVRHRHVRRPAEVAQGINPSGAHHARHTDMAGVTARHGLTHDAEAAVHSSVAPRRELRSVRVPPAVPAIVDHLPPATGALEVPRAAIPPVEGAVKRPRMPEVAPLNAPQAAPRAAQLSDVPAARVGVLLLLAGVLLGLGALVCRSTAPAHEHQWGTAFGPRPAQAPSRSDRVAPGAWEAIAAARWSEAAQLLWEHLAANGGSPWVYYHLGLCYEHLDRALEAEAAYRAALQADPEHPNAAFNLAVLLASRGELAQAAIAYRQHLAARPRDAQALYNLGHVYRDLRMPREAEVHWTTARKVAPRTQVVRRDLQALRRDLRGRAA